MFHLLDERLYKKLLENYLAPIFLPSLSPDFEDVIMRKLIKSSYKDNLSDILASMIETGTFDQLVQQRLMSLRSKWKGYVLQNTWLRSSQWDKKTVNRVYNICSTNDIVSMSPMEVLDLFISPRKWTVLPSTIYERVLSDIDYPSITEFNELMEWFVFACKEVINLKDQAPFLTSSQTSVIGDMVFNSKRSINSILETWRVDYKTIPNSQRYIIGKLISILDPKSIDDYLILTETKLHTTFTEQFSEFSQWHMGLVGKLRESYEASAQVNSGFSEQCTQDRLSSAVGILLWIAKDIFPNPLKDHLAKITIDEFNRLVVARSKDITVDTTKTRWSVGTTHSASYMYDTFNRLFKIISPEYTNNKFYTDLLCTSTKSSVLNSIENMNIQANKADNSEKILTDEEIDSLISLACPVGVLAIIILREVALRHSAIKYLRLRDIWADDAPKDTWAIREKFNKLRYVDVSMRMKKAVLDFMSHKKTYSNDSYIFSCDGDKPHSDWFVRWIKPVVYKAGITRSVHAHMFRYTLVSKLLDSNNKLEVVSKFIGHNNIDTTARFYWRTSQDVIARSLKNPLLNDFITNDDDVRSSVREMFNQKVLLIKIWIQLIQDNLASSDASIVFNDFLKEGSCLLK